MWHTILEEHFWYDTRISGPFRRKFVGDKGVLQKRPVMVSMIRCIGKERNRLEESEAFGLDNTSYVMYEDPTELDRKIKELSDKILQLQPKKVKEFGISKQVLSTVRQKIKLNQLEKISEETKNKLVAFSLNGVL